MKSEHRHELQTNELSAGLAGWIDKVKPFTGQIITGAVLLALVYAGLAVWDARSAEKEKAAWDAYALAIDTSDPEMKSLQRIANDDQYAGTKMQEWAYMGWADRQVLNAMGSYLFDRKITKDRLQGVSDIYEQFSSRAADPQIQNRARFGLARVYELQNKIDEARQQYLTVRGNLQPQASDRAKQLESKEVLAACSWLATAELPKRDLTGGQGATGTRPEFDADLPDAQSTLDVIGEKSIEELLGDPSSEGETPVKPEVNPESNVETGAVNEGGSDSK